MPRIRKFVEVMPARFVDGTFGRIDAVLTPIEDRAGFVREAVERELRRRERGAAADPPTARQRTARRGRAA